MVMQDDSMTDASVTMHLVTMISCLIVNGPWMDALGCIPREFLGGDKESGYEKNLGLGRLT